MFKFMSKKVKNMSGWESIKLSGVVTAVYMVPYLGYCLYEWVDDKITMKRIKEKAKEKPGN